MKAHRLVVLLGGTGLHFLATALISVAASRVFAFPWHSPLSLWLSTSLGPLAIFITPPSLWGEPNVAATLAAALLCSCLMFSFFLKPRRLTFGLLGLGYLFWLGFGLAITYGGK